MTPSASVTCRSMRCKVLGCFSRRRIAGVEQIVDRGLDDVERIAQFVGDAAGHLADGRQPLAALLPGQVFGLVGVLDDGQVQVQSMLSDWRMASSSRRSPVQCSSRAVMSPLRSRDRATLV